MCPQRRHWVLLFICRVAGKHPVHDTSERVDVGASVHIETTDLLRRGVVDRSHPLVCPGECRRRRAEALRDAEIGEICMLLTLGSAEEDVRWLDVAVNKATAMSGVERTRDLADNPLDPQHAGRAMRTQICPQVGPWDELHGEKEHSLPLAGAVDRHEVGVGDGGREFRFVRETGDGGRVLGVFGRDDLEGDCPVECRVRRSVHDSHPASGHHLLDDVTRKVRAGGEDRVGGGCSVCRHRYSLRPPSGLRMWPAPARRWRSGSALYARRCPAEPPDHRVRIAIVPRGARYTRESPRERSAPLSAPGHQRRRRTGYAAPWTREPVERAS